MNDGKNDKEEIDFSDALKGSDAGVKSQDEPEEFVQSFYPGTPKIIQWVIKYSGGLIKDEKQANYVLLGFMAVVIIIALVLVFGGMRSPSPPSPDEIINVAGPQGER